jgi:hypothetical protein
VRPLLTDRAGLLVVGGGVVLLLCLAEDVLLRRAPQPRFWQQPAVAAAEDAHQLVDLLGRNAGLDGFVVHR